MATNPVFCSIPTEAFKERAEQIKKKYPNLLDGNIEAVINCCSLGLTNGKRGSIPTMSEIEDYMKGRRVADFNVTEEEQDIMNRTIADGTFMKAPNGKDTNLTVKQWLQVRTKAFKDWFGDWELPIRLDKALNREGIINKEYAFNGTDFIENLKNDEIWKGLYEGLKEKFKNNELSAIKFYYADFNSKLPGIYGYDNIIYLNRKTTDFFNQLHEFIHAITSIEYHNNKEFRKEVDNLYNTAINDSRWGKDNLKHHPSYSRHLYGYTSPTEFLAEALADDGFRDILSRIKYNNKKNVWQKFIDLLKKHFFVRDVSDTVFQGVINSIFEYSKVNKSIREDVSKVVDENGEPMVVYHGTNLDFNTFEYDEDYKRGRHLVHDLHSFFFTTSYEKALKYKHDKVIPVFLNIKNPGYSSVLDDSNKPLHEYVEKENEIIKDSQYDGAQFIRFDKEGDNNGTTPTLQWVAKYPNQIKSATDNNGEFGKENDDIRYNQETQEGNYIEVIYNHPDGKKYVEKDKSGYRLIVDRRQSLQDSMEAVRFFLQSRGLPTDYIGVTPDGHLYEKTRKYPLEDQIKAYEDSESLFENAKQQQQTIEVLNFLKEKTGLEYSFITEEEAKEKLKNEPNFTEERLKNTNAFVQGGTVFFIKGRKLNVDIAAEEMLHPFVASIKTSNSEAFNSLLKEAYRAFPALAKAIESTYLSDKDEELVTQALSRTFRKDYEKNPNHNSIKELFVKFWNYVKGWFRNSGDIPIFNNTDKLYAKDLSETITLTNLAKIINSELLLGNANYISRTALNQNQQQAIETPIFKEESSSNYRDRTIKNAKADATIALAVDFSSAGERLTKKAVEDNGKKYIPVNTNNPEITEELVESIVNQLNEVGAKSLNIAGNGIYTLRGKYTQEQVDNYVYELLNRVLNHPNLKTKIESIRSGGQTGYDEAGIKAAIRLGIKNGILAPKGWKFRDANGKDISDEQAFKARFVISQTRSSQQPIDYEAQYKALNKYVEERTGIKNFNIADVDNLNEKDQKTFDDFSKRNSKLITTLFALDYRVNVASNKEASDLGGDERYFKALSDIRENQDLINKIVGQQQAKEQIQDVNAQKYIDQSQLDEQVASVFTSQQREDRVNMLAKLFSRTVDALIARNAEQVKDRKAFVVANSQRIFDTMKAWFNPERTGLTDYQRQEFKKVLDNFQALIQQASDKIAVNESVAFDFILNEANGVSSQDLGNNDNDNTDPEANALALKDGWMIKARQLDLRETLSAETRRILNNIVRVRPDGKIDVDDLGIERYIDPDYAHLTILEEVSKITKSSEFDAAIERLANKHPWMRLIQQEFRKDHSIKAKFYQDMRKELVPYWMNRNGKTKQVNIKPSTLYMFQNWQMNELAENRLDDDSIWDATGAPSKAAAEKGAKLVDSIETQLNDKGEEAVVKDNIKTLQKIARMLGIGVSDNTLEDALLNVVDSTKEDEPIYGIEQFLNSARTIFSGINDEKFNIGAGLITDYFKSAYYKIADILNDLPEGVTIASFRENGKNYVSYTNPSYLGKMLTSIKGENWQAYMEKEFGRFKHFRKNGVYRIDMLRKLTSPLEGKKYRAMLDRKVVLHYNGLEFDDWTPQMYLREMMDEFYSDPSKEGGDKWAWYYLPLLSDAPSAEYIKFVRYTDEPNTSGSVEEKIIPKLGDIVRQEIDRINTVLARKKRIDAGEIQPIANYDIIVDKDGKTKLNGAKFYFFPRLNSYVDPNTGRTFLQEYIARQQVNQSDADLYLDSVISEDVKAGYNQFIQENGLKDESRSREFYYNNALMYAQTVELTTTDLAYYKNLNDFQKRFKEVYAMTQRLYLESPLGKPSQNVVYLKDIKIISKLYDAVKDIFDKALREGKIDKVTHDYVLSQYKKINIADAQGIRSLESYRSILDSCGKWTDKMEIAYQNITSGKFDIADFNVLYETLKPFTFTQTAVDSGTNEGLIKVPVHHKDSEFVLLSIYQAIAQNMAPSPMMKAIGDLFDGKFSPKGEKIDMVLFESGVKAGLQGPIDLSGEHLGYDDYAKRFRKGITRKVNGKLEINPEVVHTIDMEDYGIQVVSSEHLIDHFEIIGTQFRRLIDSDIPENTVFTIRGKQFTKKELHDLYQSILTENILDSFEDVRAVFDDTEKLADRLQREMAQSGRYTDEERKAATLIEGTTDFNIPLYDPIQSRRMEQALNAIIKKNITKQTMRRGLCPQVSSVGFTDELQVRLRDEQGNLIFNENEWNDVEKAKSGMSYDNYKRLKGLRKQFNTFEDYRKTVKGNSVGYWEVYLPAYMKSLYLNYVDDEGKLDMSRIPEDMRRLIGFRVPTEAKYSMQPMYVKGFLPQQNGSAIMLPAEITATTGSDFDIDKVQLLLPQGFDVADYRKIYDNLSQKERNAWETSRGTQFSVEDEQLFELLGLPEEEVEKQSGFAKWLAYTKENNPEVFKNVEDKRVKYVGYDYTKSVQQNKRYKRNNALIDIAWSVLTNESVAEQTLGIGGFDELKRLKDIFTIMKMVPFTTIKKELGVTGGFNEVFKALANISQEKAEELAAKYERVLDPLSPTTQMYFHEQNAVGGKMIGIYAVGNAAHAIGEHHKIQLIHELEFFGKHYKKIDATLSEEGKLISKALAEFIGASVDNVKDPVLAALMQNTSTGDITNFLVRLGVPAYEAVLLLTCPYVARDKRIQGEVNLTPENVAMAINYRALRNSGEISDEEKAQLDNMANIICSRVSDLRDTVSSLAKELTEETQISRADAMTNAAGPDVASNEFRIHKIELRRDTVEREMNNIESDVLDYDFLFDGNFDKDHIRRECMKSTTPALTAMTKCGVIGTRELLNKYFPHTKPVVANLIHSKEFGLRRYIKLDTLKKEDYINLVEKFYADLYLYLLNGTEFFGNISGLNKTQNFMFTLDNIPALFDEMLKKYPELKSNYFISQLQTVKAFGRTRKIVTKNSNYSKTKKERMSLDWTQLVTDNNPEIKNLGFMLFKYSTLNGLGFSPYSFVQMVPNVIKRAIPDYIDGIRRLETYDMDNVLRPFVEQFVLNHIRTNTKLSKPIKAVEKVEGDEYFVDASVSAFDVTIRREGRSIEKVTRPALFLSFPVRTVVDGNEAIVIKYLRFDRAEDGQNVYKLVKPLGINNVAKEYYFGQQEYAPAFTSQNTQGAKRTEEEARETLDALEQAMYEAEGSDVMFDPETGDYLYGDEFVEVIIDDMPEIPEAKDPVTGQPICK